MINQTIQLKQKFKNDINLRFAKEEDHFTSVHPIWLQSDRHPE